MGEVVITPELAIGFKMCRAYPNSKLRQLLGSGMTARQVLDRYAFQEVPPMDLMALIVRPQVLLEETLDAFVSRVAAFSPTTREYLKSTQDDARKRRKRVLGTLLFSNEAMQERILRELISVLGESGGA